MDSNTSDKMLEFFDALKNCTLNTDGSEYALFVTDWLEKLKDIQVDENVINDYLCKEVDKGEDFEGYVVDISDKITGFENLLKKISQQVSGSKDAAEVLFNNLESIKKLIVKFIKYKNANKERETADVTNVSVLLESYDKKINELYEKINGIHNAFNETQKAIKTTQNKINGLNNKFDDRTFNILISTISILAIFVAVAFAGFGSFSILSTIKLDTQDSILKNTYYLVLIGFFVYNTILLCIQFMFAILKSETLRAKSLFSKTDGKRSINFFEVVDIILVVFIILGLIVLAIVPT